MSYKVVIASEFAKEAKRIAKKHTGIKTDIAKLIADLTLNPTMGTQLGHDFYKIRISISGTNKGKSGGARVITYIILNKETVLLTEIYLKSEHDSADVSILIQRLKDQGLII
jgi:mRNA-degrading endonuclease RelE of RelBE toxin-antitoxin system